MGCCGPGESMPIGSDVDVELTGVRVRRTGAYLNAGTCTWSLFDPSLDDDDNPIATGTLTYDTGSDGDYYGVIQSTVTDDLTPDNPYYVVIAFAEGGYNASKRLDTRAGYSS
jgi:hypothetical protein